MSLRLFHRFFIGLCLLLLAFTALWASGRNPAGAVTPWLIWASAAAAAATGAYLVWHLKAVRLPR